LRIAPGCDILLGDILLGEILTASPSDAGPAGMEASNA
jgi:hypothetical protein